MTIGPEPMTRTERRSERSGISALLLDRPGGSPVTAIEFSFDYGRTWTVCDTEGATADKWVNWRFTTSFDEAGDYQMTVRARTADGVVSPLSASLTFEVV